MTEGALVSAITESLESEMIWVLSKEDPTKLNAARQMLYSDAVFSIVSILNNK